MSDKYIKEITQNIPNDELNAAYDALMNSSLNETSDYEEVSMEELNEYIEGLERQAEDLRTQLAKANERVRELEKLNNNQYKTIEAMEGCIVSEKIKVFENAEIPRRAKAGCIGEFNFVIKDAICCPQCWEEQSADCDMCNGKSGETGLSDLTATVPWGLCKDIWLRMNKIYAEQLRKEQDSD